MRCASSTRWVPAAHVGPPAALHPDVETWGDLADPEVVRDAVAGVDSVCHQAAMVGLGVDFRDPAHVRASQRPRGPRNCSPHCTHAPSPVGSCSRAAWSSTAKAGIAVGSTVWSRRCRASRAPRRGTDRTTVSSMWRTIDMRTRHRGRAHRSAQRVCGDEAAPRALEQRIRARARAEHRHRTSYHNVYGPGMPCDTPYAGVASVFRQRAVGRRPRTPAVRCHRSSALRRCSRRRRTACHAACRARTRCGTEVR